MTTPIVAQRLPQVAPPRRLRRRRFSLVYRIVKMGGKRKVLFLPFFVLKAAAGAQVQHLQREIENAQAAASTAFWSELVVRPRRINRRTMAMRRCANIAPEDYGAVSDAVEDRLAVAAGYERGTASALIAGRRILDVLPRDERVDVLAALRGVMLPLTPMHGDMHMFNFCKRSAGFALVDWENYAEHGSYVLDYIDFHVHNRYFAREQNWVAFLCGLDAPDPSAVRVAERLDVAPRLLWLLYMLVRLDDALYRVGGLHAMPLAEGAALRDAARAHVAAALSSLSRQRWAGRGEREASLDCAAS
jgi:hypothetical protein